jgi:murein DD-endopeptidase MepM/ murein hydrolase activator NlpD
MSSVQRLGSAGVTPQTNFQPTVNNPNAPQAPAVQPELQPQSAPVNLNVAVASRQGIENGALTRANLQAAVPQAAAFDVNNIVGVRNNPNVTPAFLNEVNAMAQRLGTKPEYLLAVMSFETGGSFSPSVRNSQSGATGLIQFIEPTARGLGTSTAALARMSPTQQLQFVERYFNQYKGRLGTLEGVYTSVLSGTARPDPNSVLFRQGTLAYSQNSGLDLNRNGDITSGEATALVAARLYGGVSRVQQRLTDLSRQTNNPQVNPQGVDGQYGANTARAVAAFQRTQGLPSTGLLDDATGRALFGLSNAPTPAPAPAPAPTAPTDKPKIGDRGPQVEALQNNLVRLGHMTQQQVNTGPGVFGPQTEAAVKAFQSANRLSPSGVVDFATQNAMNSIISGVKRGDTGNVVEGLQNRLVELGYMTKAQVDTGRGTFGPQTEAALKRFQADNNIQQTGVLGAQTYRALQTARAGDVGAPADGSSVPLGRPAEGPITSPFGMRIHPVTGQRRMHNGIDIGAPTGTRVQTTAPGRVIHADNGDNGGFGKLVIVDHGNGYQTYYAHLSEINVRVGDTVADNQKIGEVGSTGRSTGPHLHYEVRLNGEPQDPARFIR